MLLDRAQEYRLQISVIVGVAATAEGTISTGDRPIYSPTVLLTVRTVVPFIPLQSRLQCMTFVNLLCKMHCRYIIVLSN